MIDALTQSGQPLLNLKSISDARRGHSQGQGGQQ